MTDQKVTQVRAHDVRAMAASLAFKGSVFTNFYVKDMCRENDNIFKLGPIVSAQHVVDS